MVQEINNNELSAQDDSNSFLACKTLIGGNRQFDFAETVHRPGVDQRLVTHTTRIRHFADELTTSLARARPTKAPIHARMNPKIERGTETTA
jgi:hypothetical protein